MTKCDMSILSCKRDAIIDLAYLERSQQQVQKIGRTDLLLGTLYVSVYQNVIQASLNDDGY